MSNRPVTQRTGGASLDVLRFLAALFILLFHYGSTAPRDLETLLPVFRQGWLATDFFLMLSGYVLMRAYGERLVHSHMRRTHFFLRRFARLWPSHILVLLAFGAFVMLSAAVGLTPKHPEKYGVFAFIAQAFMVHGWGMFKEPSWNVPTWTISALLVCYGLFSFYVPYVYRLKRWQMALIAVLVLAGADLLALLLVHHPYVDVPFEWGLLRAIPLFVIGSLIERATAGLTTSKAVFWLGAVGALIALPLLCLLPRNFGLDTLMLALLALVLAVSGGVTFRETVVTQRMGRASFALFLVHSLVGAIWFGLAAKLVSHFGLGTAAQWGLWGFGVALAIAAAFVFDALVDKPLSQYVSRLSFVKGGV
ncbi:acyltransferase [Asticcacaulis sp. EMRT-3]|uniref:acyltransferase family protein n=1 Tax=Asticcacaulis sp. EMRT-3 TaxID=3040349 RepID=UPI0024AF3FCE|nr:acyltransferase [Asticcacaulis sp. EMRT-3]MDI7775221.1 acyltransferase [Asticcacaulis sp. EMRT-3]